MWLVDDPALKRQGLPAYPDIGEDGDTIRPMQCSSLDLLAFADRYLHLIWELAGFYAEGLDVGLP